MFRRDLFICGVLLCIQPFLYAQPIVPAVERLRDDASLSSHALGRVLTQELNCVACHAHAQQGGKQAPILTDVSSRVKVDYLARFIGQPQGVKPGTTMPNVFAGVPEREREQESTALVHYLMTLGEGKPPHAYARFGGRRRGDVLYHRLGCVACHDARADGAAVLPTSVPLGDLGAKYSLASLSAFLGNPLHARPSGRMPGMNLSTQEADDIAAYLLPGGYERPGIEYQFFQGEWGEFPDLSRMSAESSGVAEGFDLRLAGRRQYYALRFTGNLAVAREGEYTFHVGSTHSALLSVDGEVVVEQRARDGFRWRSWNVSLTAGRHDVAIDFVGRPRDVEDEFVDNPPPEIEPVLRVEFEGPGVERQPIEPAFMVATTDLAKESPLFHVDPELAAEGRALFASRGCAACHEVVESSGLVASRIAAPALLDSGSGGCLTSESSGTPDFSLDARQRAMISAYLGSLRTAQEFATLDGPGDAIAHTMLTFNCYACHARGALGGIEVSRDEYFTTTEAEMGGEGRVPPALDGVGAKLREDWLGTILREGADDRPYMLTRMPRFDAENVGALAAHFAEADAMEPLPGQSPVQLVAKSAGRHVIGANGVSCITCHKFGRYQAQRMQAIDMTIMTKRLREDWFRRYVRDPQKFRPDTQMPTFWDDTGTSQLTEILDGDSEAQIQAMWLFLSEGERAITPAGLGDRFLELIPEDEAIIYRFSIEGAGPRAIGVGFPEGVHLAFDANDSRLALIWQGGFIDAGVNWRGEGEGFQAPLGLKVKSFAPGVPLARLSSLDQKWPEGNGKKLDVRFKGYSLSPDKRPTFLYRFGELHVEDTPDPGAPTANGGVVRTMKFSGSAGEDVWFRAARSASIRLVDGWCVFDGVRMLIESSRSAGPLVRQQDGFDELLVPVSAGTEITQTIRW